jgi:hypothetical protein
MNMSDVSALSGMAAQPLVAQAPRPVAAASAQQFRDLMGAGDCGQGHAACAAQSPAQTQLHKALDLDIEKVLMANMPSPNASPAEFAAGLLRAQVKVSQAAIAIEMVSKTTQSLSQGVQSLTTRS